MGEKFTFNKDTVEKVKTRRKKFTFNEDTVKNVEIRRARKENAANQPSLSDFFFSQPGNKIPTETETKLRDEAIAKAKAPLKNVSAKEFFSSQANTQLPSNIEDVLHKEALKKVAEQLDSANEQHRETIPDVAPSLPSLSLPKNTLEDVTGALLSKKNNEQTKINAQSPKQFDSEFEKEAIRLQTEYEKNRNEPNAADKFANDINAAIRKERDKVAPYGSETSPSRVSQAGYELADALNRYALSEKYGLTSDIDPVRYDQYRKNGEYLASKAQNAADFETRNVYGKKQSQGIDAVKAYLLRNFPDLNMRNFITDPEHEWLGGQEGESVFDRGHDFFDAMTEEQKKILGYYIATDEEKAERYVEAITLDVGSIMAEKYAASADDWYDKLLYNIFSVGTENFNTGMQGAFGQLLGETGYQPPTPIQQGGAEIRYRMEENGEDALLWISDIGANVVQMIPSLVVGAFSKTAGAALMGISASGNAYNEAINKGLSRSQASTYATLVGASETLLEKALGVVGNLGGKSGAITSKILANIDGALTKAALSIPSNMASEFVEESLQTLLEPWFMSVITNEEYAAPGMDEVLYNGLIGALAGGLITIGGHTNSLALRGINKASQSIDEAKAQKQIHTDVGEKLLKTENANEDIKKLIDNAQQSGDKKLQKAANKVAKTEKDGAYDVSARKIGRLAQMSKEQLAQSLMDTATGNDLKSQTIEKLTKSGMNQKGAERAFELIVHDASRGVESKELQSLINKNPDIRTMYDNMVEYLSEEAVTKRVEDVAKASPVTEISNRIVDQRLKDAGIDVVDEATVEKDDVVDVDHVDEDGIAYVKTESGKVIPYKSDSLSISSASHKKMGYASLFGTNGAKTYFALAPETESSRYMNDFTNLYKKGANGESFSIIESNMSADVQKAIYEAGKADRDAAIKSRQKAETEAKEKEATFVKKQMGFKSDRVTLSEEAVAKIKSVSDKGISDQYKAAVKVIDGLAKMLQVNINIVASETDANGNYIGARGMYNRATNTFTFDIMSGMDNVADISYSAMIKTAGHELTHFIQNWSPSKYLTLKNTTLKFLKEQNDAAWITKRLDEIRSDNEAIGKKLTLEQAKDELVADAFEDVLSNIDFAETILRTDKTLFDKIHSWVKKHANNFKKNLGIAVKDVEAISDAAKEMRNAGERAQALYNQWADAFSTALENSTSGQTDVDVVNNLNVDQVMQLYDEGLAVDDESGEVYSVRYSHATNSEIAVGKKTINVDTLANLVATATGKSVAQAKKWINSELSLASLILKDPQFLDFAADERFDAIKKNSDYPQGTVDLSNNCPKRQEFTAMFDLLQKRHPNTLYTAADVVAMRNILAKHKLTTPCNFCFVEDRRQLLGEIADTYINMWKEAVETGKPLHKTNAEGRKIKLSVTAALAKQFGVTKGADIMPTDTYIPTQYDLTTYEGFRLLEKNHPTVAMGYIRYNNSRGQQAGRLIEGRAEYKRQILGWSDAKVRSVNNNGGLRIFSFSDFEVVHLLDIVQIIIDCAAKGVKIQGYTKVPAFAKLVRGTGIKLNRSLVPLGDTGIKVVNGKKVLAYDTVEGIDYTDENFLDESDNADIGNILIGINAEHIGIAMLDDFIDYIIPFHSNKAKDILKKLKISSWENYKESQHEKDISSGKASKKNVNIYTQVINKYNPKNKVDFVNAFLKDCKAQQKIPRYAEFLNKEYKADGAYKDEGGSFDYTYREGYHKLLVDFKMFDKNGKILPQGNITPNFDDGFITKLIEAEVKKKSSYEFPEEVFAEIEEEFTDPDTQNSARRVTKEQDSAYMEAVKNGDIETQQRMVNEAAKEWGAITNGNEKRPRPLNLYHGTGTFGFTRFRDGAIYATTAYGVAAGYNRGKGLGRVRNPSVKYIENDGTAETAIKNAKNVLGANLTMLDAAARQEVINKADNILKNVARKVAELDESTDYAKAGEFFDYITEKYGEEKSIQWTNQLDNLHYMLASEYTVEEILEDGGWLEHDLEKYHEWKQGVSDLWSEESEAIKKASLDKVFRYLLGYEYGDSLIDIEYGLGRLLNDKEKLVNANGSLIFLEDVIEAIEAEKDVGVYNLYGKAGDNPLVIDEGKRFWDAIPFEGGFKSTDYIVKWAKKKGYTSVLFKSILDPSTGGSANVYADEWVFLSPNLVKSADPITYDDNGNVIPLSERFNPENEDIRNQARKKTRFDVNTRLDLIETAKKNKIASDAASKGLILEYQRNLRSYQAAETTWRIARYHKDTDAIVAAATAMQLRRNTIASIECTKVFAELFGKLDIPYLVEETSAENGLSETALQNAKEAVRKARQALSEAERDAIEWARRIDVAGQRVYDASMRRMRLENSQALNSVQNRIKQAMDKPNTRSSIPVDGKPLAEAIMRTAKELNKLMSSKSKFSPEAETIALIKEAAVIGAGGDIRTRSVNTQDSINIVDEFGSRFKAEFKALTELYGNTKESKNLSFMYDEEIYMNLDQYSADKPDYDDVWSYIFDCARLVRAVAYDLTNANTIMVNKRAESYLELRGGLEYDFMHYAPKKMRKALVNAASSIALTPEVFIHAVFGHTESANKFNQIYDDGQNKYIDVVLAARGLFAEIEEMTDKNGKKLYGEANKKKLLSNEATIDLHMYDGDGNKVLTNEDHAISFILAAKNADYRRHIMYGGWAIPDLKKANKGKNAYLDGRTTEHILDGENDNGEIIEYVTVERGGKKIQIPRIDFTMIDNMRAEANRFQAIGEIDKAIDLRCKLALANQEIKKIESDWEKKILEAAGLARLHLSSYANACMQKLDIFYNNVAKAFLDEATEERYGFKKTLEKNHYYPIQVVKEQATQAELNTLVKQDYRVSALGSMKRRVRSRISCKLYGAVSSFAYNVENTAKYYGYLNTLNYIKKITGVSYDKMTDEEGKKKQTKEDIVTLGGYIDRNLGNTVFTDYLYTLESDISGGKGMTTAADKALDFVYSGFVANALFSNLSPTAKQIPALLLVYPDAGLSASIKGIIKGATTKGDAKGKTKLPMGLNEAQKRYVAKYSRIYKYRSGGLVDADLADFKQSNHPIARVMSKHPTLTGMNWMERTDSQVLGLQFYAILESVKKSNPNLSAQEAATKAGEILDKTIQHFQANSTVLQRAPLLRSKGSTGMSLARVTVGTFKSQQLTMLNAKIDSLLKVATLENQIKELEKSNKREDAEKLKSLKSELSRSKKYAARVAAATMVSYIINAAFTVAIQLLYKRTDDEDELLETYGWDLLQSYMSIVPGVGDAIYYLVEQLTDNGYYGDSFAEVGLLGVINDFVDVIGSIRDGEYTVDRIAKDIGKLVAPFGVPARNVWNIVKAIFKWIGVEIE